MVHQPIRWNIIGGNALYKAVVAVRDDTRLDSAMSHFLNTVVVAHYGHQSTAPGRGKGEVVHTFSDVLPP